MCLLIQGKRKIAKKDILCYKVLKEHLDINGEINCLYSPYFERYEWVLGREAVNEMPKPGEIDDNKITNGYFHSFSSEKDALDESWWHTPHLAERIGVYKCVIPKGSIYYCGEHSGGGEGYASKRLKITEKTAAETELYPVLSGQTEGLSL